MTRGRSPAKTDDSAILALAKIVEFMREKAHSATFMAKLIEASPSSVLRALKENPPRWTRTFSKLDNFVKLQNNQNAASTQPLAEQITKLHEGGAAASASAAAALLRAVADLLENRAGNGQQ